MPDLNVEYSVGDWVAKVKGYTYIGKVRSIYQKGDGAIRVDVELTYPRWWQNTRNGEGMLHVFAANDLKKVNPNDVFFVV